MIEDPCRACSKVPLKPSKCCSPWYRSWRLVIALISSTFWLSAFESSLCQNGLRKSHCGTCLSVLSGWFSERTENFSNRASAWYLPSPLIVPLISAFWLLYHHPIAQETLFSCLQCLQCRDLCQLAHFRQCLRTDTIAVGLLSRGWGLGVRKGDVHTQNAQPWDSYQQRLQSI